MKRRVIGSAVALTVALAGLCGCGSASSPSGRRTDVADVTGVAASCAGLTPRQQLTAATIVVEGRMLRGRTVRVGPGHTVLASPARLRVSRYVKGRGPHVVRVQTAVMPRGSGYVANSEGIEPAAGQRWRIYSDHAKRPLRTSICAGSHRLRSHRR
jgi:hypothetical protein